jgi:hypothetical protein
MTNFWLYSTSKFWWFQFCTIWSTFSCLLVDLFGSCLVLWSVTADVMYIMFLIYKYPMRCNSTQYIFFVSLQIYSTCFGCHLHTPTGVQETLVIDHWQKSYVTIGWTVFIVRWLTHFTMAKWSLNLTMVKCVLVTWLQILSNGLLATPTNLLWHMTFTNGLWLQFPVLLMVGVNGTWNM